MKHGDPKDAGAQLRHYQGFTRVASQAEARSLLADAPDQIAIIHRSEDRSVLMRCPCGCGEVLVVNLDPKAGRAWRARFSVRGVTLLPSVWRLTGCLSHFVLWESRVWWCRFEDEDVEPVDEWPEEVDRELRAAWASIRKGRTR